MTDNKDLIERLAWPVNPREPKEEVNLPAWVLELCAEARQALESAQVERDTVWAEATAAAYGAAADIAHEGALATEDDGVAAWVRDRIKAQTPQSARDWLAVREAAIRADERAKVIGEANAKINDTPCTPMFPDKWSDDALVHYEAGQRDAADSWRSSIDALYTDASREAGASNDHA